MDAIYIIKKPLLTEKSTYGMNETSQYTFLVDRRSTKDEIKLKSSMVSRLWGSIPKTARASSSV